MSAMKQRASKRNNTSSPYVDVPAPIIEISEPGQFGRVNVMDFTPTAEQDRYPARVELGEAFTVTAQVFIEGRTKVGATAVIRNPQGKVVSRTPMTCTNAGLDRWEATVACGERSLVKPWERGFAAVARQLGAWTVTIEGWEDTYISWLHDARIKVEVNDDVSNALISGAALFERWAASKDAQLNADEKKALKAVAKALVDESLEPSERLEAADNPHIAALHDAHPLRDGLSASVPHTFQVERPGSSFAAWYQFFPRSEGATIDATTGKIKQGTLASSTTGLKRAADQGFDIVYLPPIFPVGRTNRKGPDGALVAGPDDPGSPFGIGSELGGHDTVDPKLGTLDDFKKLTAKAHKLGLEIALDFALQCSPDHPWVKEHPNWFRHKPDGTIAFAENPPKKYQDIYPIDFNADMEGIEREVVRILTLWIDAGVTIFRVDNPHTKPVRFWQDVIAEIKREHPEILFLAEAFTRPGMMRALSYVGFTQSHCYFPWRNAKWELEGYLPETNGEDAFWQHNTFWPTTPDILTAYLRDNGVAGHAVRAVLAAMGSPSWGIYNGFELLENRQRDGVEEQADNEKYAIKVRDWSQTERYGIAELLTALNRIRHNHIAAFSYHNLTMLPTDSDQIIAFARHTPADLTGTGKPETLIVVVNLDGRDAHQTTVHVDLTALGLDPEQPFTVHDELTDQDFEWSWDNYVYLAPWADVAHVLSVQY